MLKINPLQSLRVNPYQKQQFKQQELQQAEKKKDELQISSEAKELQKESPIQTQRNEKVTELKEKVQSGQYEVNPKKLAQKMYDYWNEQ
ncbi:flagellar biosynthesis anti-sigma factor FlgM [Bacillus tianshenii]|nr:flagellar biosynthesis anti-sigma factor FlgM [Bacillus tianshenii]